MTAASPRILDVLPEDILLTVFGFLSLNDILKMRQVSSTFGALTHARGLWTDLLHRYVIGEGLPIPKLQEELRGDPVAIRTTIPDNLDTAALERCIRRALTLRRAWTSPSPKPARHLVVSVQEECLESSAWRIVSLHFCGHFLLSVSFTSVSPPERERLPLVFRSWDLRQRKPRCVSSMFVPFRSSFKWNTGLRKGRDDPVLAVVPSNDFETKFYGLDADGEFQLMSTSASTADLRALHGTTVLTRHGMGDTCVWDMRDTQSHCVLKNPQSEQPETFVATHLHGRFLLIVWTRALQIFDLSGKHTPDKDGKHAIVEALAHWRWPWPIDSARATTLHTSLASDDPPPFHIFLRFSSFLPWPVNMLHHYLLSPSTEPDTPAYALPPRAVVSIPSHVRLFSVSDMALGSYGAAVWIDSATEDEDTGKRLAGTILQEPSTKEPEGHAQVTTFDKTSSRETEPWLHVEVDDEEGRIAVASFGQFELYEFI
ncbi:hypothetical protein EV121DRAFT_288160 [Schizophyllum commune]